MISKQLKQWLLLCGLFLLVLGAQAQVTQAEYFWDTDPGQGNGISLTAKDGNFNSALETAFKETNTQLVGLHTFSIRFKDNAGTWGNVFAQTISIEPAAVIAPPQIAFAEYFWDNDPGQGNGVTLAAYDGDFNNALEIAFANSSSQPAAGLHTFSIRFKDNSGNWGNVFTNSISIEPTPIIAPPQIAFAEYFWDNDPGQGNGTTLAAYDGDFDNALEAAFANSNSQPAAGLHTFNIRFKDNSGTWGNVFTNSISIEPTPVVAPPQIAFAEYFWDTDPGQGSGTTLAAYDGDFDNALEIAFANSSSQPAAGLHTFSIRFKDNSGTWGNVFTNSISIEPTPIIAPPQIAFAEYFWDTDPGQGNGTTLAAFDGDFDNALETAFANSNSQPAAGLHTFSIRFKDNSGTWGNVFRNSISIEATPNVAAPRINLAEYFWDTDPGQGNGITMAVFDGNFDNALEIAMIPDANVSVPEGVHTLYVRLADANGVYGSPFGVVVNVTTNPNPNPTLTPPTLLLPTNLATNQLIAPLLDWANVTGATSYDYEYSTSATFASNVVSGNVANSTANISGLAYSTVYYWRVRAKNVDGVSAWSGAFSFTTRPVPTNINAPSLVSPSDNSLQWTGVTFDWNAVASVQAYQLQWDTVATFNSPIRGNIVETYINSSSANADTEQFISNLRFGTRYFWRVRAYTALDTSAWTSIRSFNTVDYVNLSSPSSGTIQWTGLTLDWASHTGVAFYDWQVDTVATFNSPARKQGTNSYINSSSANTDTETFVSDLFFGKKYFWRVRARNNAVDTSAWTMRDFSTVDYVNLSSPNSGTIQWTGLTLDWASHTGVDFYDWQVDTVATFNSPARKQGTNSYINSSSTNTDTETFVSDLFFGKKYYWRVRARNSAVDTTGWTMRDFNTVDYVNLSSPNSGTIQWTGLTLDWASHTGVDFYDWQVDTVATFNSPARKQGTNSYINSSSANADTEIFVSDLFFGKKYFWRVRARNGATDTTGWTMRDFNTVDYVNLSSPSSGTIQWTGLTLDWVAHTGVDFYDWQVDTVATFNSPARKQGTNSYINSSSTNTDTETSVADLFFGKKYYWRVRARNGAIDTCAWTMRDFNTVDYVNLVSPNNNATNVSTAGTTLNWDAHPTVNTYALEFDVSNLFNTGSVVRVNKTYINTSSTNTDTQHSTGTLQANTTYFWRVRAINDVDTCAWTMRTFTTGAVIVPLPNAPTLISPSNGATNQPTSVSLDWSDITGATRYEYQYSLNSSFSNPVTGTATVSTANISGLAENTVYYWRVRTINGNLASVYSSIFSFTTATPLVLSAPTLISPSNDATNQATSLTFDWSDVTNALEYEYQYSTSSTFTSPVGATVSVSTANISGLADATTYFWRVRAKNGSVLSAYSSIFSFTTATPLVLSAPTLISPSNGATNQPTSLTFDWSDVTNALEYEYQYSLSSTFTSPVGATVSVSTANISGLADATTYFWRVRAKNGSVLSAYSSIFSFTTATPLVLSAPTLISPSNGATNQATSLTFDWSDVTNALEYEYQYSLSSTFTSPVGATVSVSTANISGLADATTYFWRVRAKNGSVLSAYSSIFSFTTATPLVLSAPTLISPSNGATNQATSLTFDWSDVSNALEYEYQYSLSSTFTSPVNGTATISEAGISGLADATTYFWRVRAKNGSVLSAYSSIFSFTTATPLVLSAPTLISPSNGATNQPTSLTFDWSDVTDALEYEYQYSTSSTFTSPVGATVSVSTANVSGLADATTYFWRVRAKNGSVLSAYSSIFSFTTATPLVLSAPTLILPSNGASNQATSLTFDWSDVSNALEYEYQYSTSSTFTSPVNGTATISEAGISGLADATTYFWRVRAKNGSVLSAYSSIFSFTTATPLVLSAPTLISPSNGATNQATSLTFDWSDVSNALEYEYQYSTSSTFTSPVNGTVSVSTANVSGLADATTYFWRVRAKNGSVLSAYSSIFSFTTATPLVLAAPTLISPSNGATNQPLNVVLDWSNVSIATTYVYEWSIEPNFLLPESETVTASTASPANLFPFTTYYWRVKAKNATTESDWSEVWQFTTDNIISVKSPLEGLLKIYPNPAREGFWLSLEGKISANDLRYNVVNALGQKVSEGSLLADKQWINTSAWAAGMYRIEIYGNSFSAVKTVHVMP